MTPHLQQTIMIATVMGIGWLMTRSLTKRYVETEAASIKMAAEASTT